MCYNLIVITGPTASGKTSLAVRIADLLKSEIISADSRQVYRALDIGTGKDLHEYRYNNKDIPYHLIDILDFNETFDLFQFYKSFFRLFRDFQKRNIIPILAGGTPLYVHSVIANYKLLEVPENKSLRDELHTFSDDKLVEHLKKIQPDLHNITDLEDRERLFRAIEIATYRMEHSEAYSPGEGVDIKPLIITPFWERNVLKGRIRNRLLARLDEGMADEVRGLYDMGCSWERLDYFGLEYRYVSLYLQGKMSYENMVSELNIKINQFSKRQNMWIKKFEKEGFKINRVEEGSFEKASLLLRDLCV